MQEEHIGHRQQRGDLAGAIALRKGCRGGRAMPSWSLPWGARCGGTRCSLPVPGETGERPAAPHARLRLSDLPAHISQHTCPIKKKIRVPGS